MDKQRGPIKTYICSNVGLDYFFFLCKTIADERFEVEPVYLLSEQKYRQLAKVKGIKRIWLRFQMYLVYPLILFFKALFAPSGSIFIVTSNTFYAPLVIVVLLRFRNIKVVHLLYDLFPDAMEVAGKTPVNSNVSKIVGKLTEMNQELCEGTVYLGDFLKQHAESRWGKASKSSTIHISTDLALYDPEFREDISSKKIIIHYGGQLGYLHDAVSIIECIKEVLSKWSNEVEFNFYVSGAQASFLGKELEGYPVKVIPAIPSSQWREDIRSFHIGLVSLSPGGASVCLPSKTYGMMAGGMAIIGICPEWSDLANLIKEVNGGWVVNNSIYEELNESFSPGYLEKLNEKRGMESIKDRFMEVIAEVLNSPELLSNKRRDAFNGVRSQHNIDVLRKQWHEFILALNK